MAITLGKDCTVTLGGLTIASARNVTLSESARTIDVNPYGSRYAGVYSTGYECTVSVEFNDSADVAGAFAYMHQGLPFTVTGGASRFSFSAVLTSISESDPIDGVVTYTIEGRMTDPRLTRS